MDLSVINPTYNEAHKIAVDIGKLSDYLSNNRMTAEIIISDDGSSDDTVAVAKKCGSADNYRKSNCIHAKMTIIKITSFRTIKCPY